MQAIIGYNVELVNGYRTFKTDGVASDVSLDATITCLLHAVVDIVEPLVVILVVVSKGDFQDSSLLSQRG